ncbi:hypothetical protein [Pseudoalteromonas phage J2-1_QLiu-2017]|nr:hypothetical protein [Pseudoalteromonas phage J2-1_QLiu-2017]
MAWFSVWVFSCAASLLFAGVMASFIAADWEYINPFNWHPIARGLMGAFWAGLTVSIIEDIQLGKKKPKWSLDI